MATYGVKFVTTCYTGTIIRVKGHVVTLHYIVDLYKTIHVYMYIHDLTVCSRKVTAQ